MTAAVLEDRHEQPEGRRTGESEIVDLAFVGAGASTSYVLLALLEALCAHPPAARLRIGVIERDPDCFPGVAYGGRAARTSLLITPLHDFLPDEERALFTAWLSANKGWVFDEFRACRGPLSSRWWARHRATIERDDFGSLYLPRYVFGAHLRQRVLQAAARARAAGVANTLVVRDEVLAIHREAGDHLLRGRGQTVRARRVVLAIGSPAVLPRLGPGAGLPDAGLVDDPFAGMTSALERVRATVQRAAARPHVVLIGGNAGSMDMLYQLNDLAVPELQESRFTVLSPSGNLPVRVDEHPSPTAFVAEEVEGLTRESVVEAAAVYDAALRDIARGRATGLTVAETLEPVSRAVGRLLPRLSVDGAIEFAGRWGVELGRRQRRAGWEYSEVVEDLVAQARFRLVPGTFVDVRSTAEDGVVVRYRQDGELRDLAPPAHVVVNCGGPSSDLRAGGSLVSQLLTDGVCRTTPFGRGIAVDQSLAAAPGLYVMGPLLAGNLLDGGPLWHMEHCGRISAFGSAFGRQLARDLAPETAAAETA